MTLNVKMLRSVLGTLSEITIYFVTFNASAFQYLESVRDEVDLDFIPFKFKMKVLLKTVKHCLSRF